MACEPCESEQSGVKQRRCQITAVNPLRVRFVGSLEDVTISYQSVAPGYEIGDEAVCTEVAPAQWMLTDVVKPQNTVPPSATGAQPPAQVFVMSAASDGSVLNVSWIAPNDLGDTNGWQIVVRDGSVTGDVVVTKLVTAVGTLTSAIMDLTAGTTYWVGVAGVVLDTDDTVESLSNYIGYTISTSAPAPPPTSPGAPTIGTVTASVRRSESVLTVPWTAPETGGTVFTYEVVRQANDDSDFTDKTAADDESIASRSAAVTRIIDGSVQRGYWYRYKVRATGLGGTGDFSAWSNVLQVPNPQPADPTNVVVTVQNTSPANVDVQYWTRLTWTKGTGGGPVTDFEVQRQPAAQGAMFTDLAAVPADTTVHNDHTVNRGVTYAYRVRARGPGGTSNWVAASSTATVPAAATQVAPVAPTTPAVALKTRTEGPPTSGVQVYYASVTWGLQAMTGVPSRYEIQRRYAANTDTSDSAWDDMGTVLGDVRVFNDFDVAGGVTYAYRIRAANDSGVSQWAPAAGDTAITVSIPGAPTPANPVSAAAVLRTRTEGPPTSGVQVYYSRVTWGVSAGTALPTYYDVQRRYAANPNTADASWDDMGTTPGNVREFNDFNINRGVGYIYRVRARISSRTSGWVTASGTVTVPTDPDGTAPDPPTGLALTLRSQTFAGVSATYYIDVDWTAPVDSAGTVTGYEVQRIIAAQGNTTYVDQAVVPYSRYFDWSVRREITYGYRVRSYGPGGTSGWLTGSSTVAVPAAEPPSSPPRPDPAPSFTATPGDGRVTLNWTVPSPADPNRTGWQIDYRITNGPVTELWQRLFTGTGASRTYTHSTANGDRLNYRIRAYGPGGISDWVIIDSPVTPRSAAAVDPNPPTAFTAAPDDGQVVLGWTLPADGGGTRSGFDIEHRITNGPPTELWQSTTRVTASVTTYTHSTANGDRLNYRIRAYGPSLVSDWVYIASPVIPQSAAATAPNAVASLSATPADSRVTLNWQVSSGGGTWRQYRIEHRILNGPPTELWQPTTTISSRSVATYPHAVANGDRINYRIRAEGPSKVSAWTYIGSPVTVRDADRVAPNPPGSVSATFGIGQGATTAWIRLTWGAPAGGGGTRTGFEVWARITNGPPTETWQRIAAPTSSPHTVSGVQLYDGWDYRVRAVGPGGESAFSYLPGDVLPQPSAPSAVGDVSGLSAGVDPDEENTINVSWDPP